MSKLAETVRDEMKAIIATVFEKYGGSIALDCWTDKHKKMCYFGITLHFITEENGKLILNDRILLIRELAAEKKDGEYLREKLYEYMTEYGLMNYLEKKIVFISDRGTNIVNAVRAFTSINCFAHLIHNVVQHMLHDNAIVMAVSVIVKYFKASGLHATFFTKSLKSYVSTRWNTVYTMFATVIENWTQINQILRRTKKHLKELDFLSLDKLILMKTFLEPFKDATDEVEATKHPTIDSVQPSYNKLLQHMQPICTDPTIISELKEVGLDYWTRNVKKHISIYHDVAIFLNPLMKSLKWYTLAEKTRIWSKASELMENFAPFERDDSSQRTTEHRVKPRRMSQAMAMFMDDDNFDGDRSDQNELEEYKAARVAEFDDILPWWQSNKMRFPRLYGVARLIFSIPASSAAAERLFSKAGKLVNNRPNLRSELVDDILFLNSNFDMAQNRGKIVCDGSEIVPNELIVDDEISDFFIDDDVIECINLNEDSE